jgi:anti-sigma-K factor RskA
LAADPVHGLTAGYALDALDEAEQRAYEQHLARCERCQAELAAFSTIAGALAFAAEPATPPPALRERILETARAERPNVVPLRARSSSTTRVAALVAAVASVAAIGLAVWNVDLHDRLDRAHRAQTALALKGASGSVVVGANGEGTLTVTALRPAEPGKTYEAWVIRDGKATRAGLFRGGKTSVVHLTKKVPHGAIVAITIEPAGGSEQPTTQPIVTSGQV